MISSQSTSKTIRVLTPLSRMDVPTNKGLVCLSKKDELRALQLIFLFSQVGSPKSFEGSLLHKQFSKNSKYIFQFYLMGAGDIIRFHFRPTKLLIIGGRADPAIKNVSLSHQSSSAQFSIRSLLIILQINR